MITRIHDEEQGVYYDIQYNGKNDRGWGYSLYNQDGEGVSISEQNLFDLLHEHFMKEF